MARKRILMFIIVHQSMELWFKLVFIELQSMICAIRKVNLRQVNKSLNLINSVFQHILSSWNVLSNMECEEFLAFRDKLGQASGIQSFGFRKFDFMLGNKNSIDLNTFIDYESEYNEILNIKNSLSVYQEIVIMMGQHFPMLGINEVVMQPTELPEFRKDVYQAWSLVFESQDYAELAQIGKGLYSIQSSINQWRKQHIKIVQKMILSLSGTGQTSGVEYLINRSYFNYFPEIAEIDSITTAN